MNEDKVEYVFDQHSSQPPQVISMTQERYDAAIAEARAAEREQCCKDICNYCANGASVKLGQFNDWEHQSSIGWGVYCKANAIRQRASKE